MIKIRKAVSIVLLMTIMLTGFLPSAAFVAAAPIEESTPEETVPVEQTEETVPPAEEPAPPTEEPAPPTEEPAPPAEEPVPPAEEPVPPAEEPVPPAEEPAPPMEEQEPAQLEEEPQEMMPLEEPENAMVPEGDGAIQLDGEFSDWVNMPSYDTVDNDGAQDDERITLQWYLSQDEQQLYIMTSIHKPHKNGKGNLKTQIETDFGKYNMKVDYAVLDDTDVVSVMTSLKIKKQSWIQGGNWGRVMPDGSIQIEYVVPLEGMLEGMQWGYLIQFRLLNGSQYAPKNSWITVSSASTFPYVGVAACIILGIAIPTIIRKRKTEKCLS